MNEDPTPLERELRRLRPLPASEQLQQRLAGVLDAMEITRTKPRAPWWQCLGFNRPAAALGWGLLSPCAAACVAMMVVAGPWTVASDPVQSPLSTAKTDTALAHPQELPSEDTGNRTDVHGPGIKAVNVLYQRLDEGVVLDGGKEPVRRVRYRSADRVRWHNPQTGAQWEISYPREDVLLIPVNAE